MKTVFTFLLMGLSAHAMAQAQPSVTEILQHARTHYERAQQLSAAVDYWSSKGNQSTPFHQEINVSAGSGKLPAQNDEWQAGICLDGVLYGDTEDVFTILLRRVDQGGVAMQPATIDDKEFIHVTGEAPEGRYELWLDPAADYRLTQSIVRKSGNNPLFGKAVMFSPRWGSLEATVIDMQFEALPEGSVAVAGRMTITGSRSALSCTFGPADAETYRFSRKDCRFGASSIAAASTAATSAGVE